MGGFSSGVQGLCMARSHASRGAAHAACSSGMHHVPSIPEPVFHACAAPLDERDQDSAVNDLHREARDPVIRLIERLTRTDVVPPAVGRTAYDRAA